MRKYSSFRGLIAPGHRKLRPLLVDDPNSPGMDHIREYEGEEAQAAGWPSDDRQPVAVVPRLSDAEYDALLSRSVVFLDLLDASGVTTVVECLARCTPVLINPLAPIREYLG